jgi:uncharacterized repeat protein (TIGR01451 family)
MPVTKSLPVFKTVVLLTCLFFTSGAYSQVWHWGRSPIVAGTSSAFFKKTAITSKGNILAVEGIGKTAILSLYDQFGGLQWKRTLYTDSALDAVTLFNFELDANDNIYFLARPIVKIDADPVQVSGPLALIKLNPKGRFLWSKPFTSDKGAYTVKTNLVIQNSNLFFSVHSNQSVVYEGTTYTNVGANPGTNFLFALDTAGHTRWVKKIYAPISGNNCSTGGSILWGLSANKNNQLLFFGAADKTQFVNMDATRIIDSATCQPFIQFAGLMNATTGALIWGGQVPIDSIAGKPNAFIVEIYYPSKGALLLDNGNSVLYNFQQQDTSYNSKLTPIDALSQVCIMNNQGKLVKKITCGAYGNNLYAIQQLRTDEKNNIYASVIVFPTKQELIDLNASTEIRKYDPLFELKWQQKILYAKEKPATVPGSFDYKNNSGVVTVEAYTPGESQVLFGNQLFNVYNYTRYILARIIDSTNLLSGYVYFDLNKNNQIDTGEPLAANLAIGSSTGDTIYTFTDKQGFFMIPFSDLGNYTLTVKNVQNEYPYFGPSPASASISFNKYGNFLNQNFALQATRDIADGKISITYYGVPRPNGTITTKIVYKNTGTTALSGTYHVIKNSSKLTTVRSKDSWAAVKGDTTIYNFTLQPLEEKYNLIDWKLSSTASLTDTFIIKTVLHNVPELAGNNKDSALIPVRSSFDPNDKQALPFAAVNHDSALVQKEFLHYIIRFQNTGNDTAFTITVKDTLGAKLDINTFQLVSASHNLQVQWENPRTAVFYFSNILLPDSTTNESLSHGYVRFRIKPVAGVALTDSIYNKAAIYFDYNAPVITNTVLSTFAKRIPVVTGIGDLTNLSKNMVLYPNPVREEIICKIVKHPAGELLTITLYDIQGKQILQKVKKSTGGETFITLPAMALLQGLYTLQVTGKSGHYIKLFVKE